MDMKPNSNKRINSRKRIRKLHVFYKVSSVILTIFLIIAGMAVVNPKFLRQSLVGKGLLSSGSAVTGPHEGNVSSAVSSQPLAELTVKSEQPLQSIPSSEPSEPVSSEDSQESSKLESTTPPENLPVKDPVEDAVPQSAAVPDSYFDDAVFIGDSRTEGFMMYAGPEGADYFTLKGLNVETAFDKPAITIGGNKVSVVDALKYGTYGKVYIMLGVNELGWAYSELFIKRYGELVEAIRRIQPNAEIYVQSILPVTKEKSEKDAIYNNANIKKYNDLIVQMTKDKGVHFLNVKEAVEDSSLCLPDRASTDGIHLNGEYCRKWMEYLRTHTVGRKGVDFH